MTELLNQLMNQRLDRPLREDEFRNPADKLVYCKHWICLCKPACPGLAAPETPQKGERN